MRVQAVRRSCRAQVVAAYMVLGRQHLLLVTAPATSAQLPASAVFRVRLLNLSQPEPEVRHMPAGLMEREQGLGCGFRCC